MQEVKDGTLILLAPGQPQQLFLRYIQATTYTAKQLGSARLELRYSVHDGSYLLEKGKRANKLGQWSFFFGDFS